MKASRTAPHGAAATSNGVGEDTVWLGSAHGLRVRRSGRKGALLRLTATLAASALLTISSAQSAVGPAVMPSLTERLAAALRATAPITIAVDDESSPVFEAAWLAGPSLRFPLDERAGADRPTLAEELGLAASREGNAVPVAQPERSDEMLRFDGVRVPRSLVETILRAAEVTGVDATYMMALADKESSFVADSKAPTSSAQGLFQFIEKTWFEVVRDYGPKHGLDEAASVIETVNGQLTVADEGKRSYVLGLRRDPYLSALMAGEMLKRDRTRIERRIGRELERSELYLLHFFGADSAGRLLELVSGKPKQSAPRIFPQAAKANRTLFFAQEKRKTRHLTVSEVYQRIDRMIDVRLGRYEGVTSYVPIETASLR